METEKKLALMQNVYAASLAETVNTYEKLKVLDYIVDRKKAGQEQTAPLMIRQLGIETAEQVFLKLSEVFDCANWQVERTDGGLTATATACKLCALSRRMGGANPCRGWCLDPMTAMIRSVSGGRQEDVRVTVVGTLMDGDRCRVEVRFA